MSGEASYALPVAGLLAIGDPGNKVVEAQIVKTQGRLIGAQGHPQEAEVVAPV